MTLYATDVRFLIHNTVHWRECADGSYNAYVPTPQDPSGTKQHYPVQREELEQLHPTLPLSMRAMFNFARSMSSRDVPGQSVSNTLRYLEGTCIEFIDTTGALRTTTEITSVSTLPNMEHCFMIAGRFYVVENAIADGQDVSFVTKENITYFFGTSVDLEQRYPGFLSKWELAKDLGLADSELIAHLFDRSSSHVSPTSLSELSFE